MKITILFILFLALNAFARDEKARWKELLKATEKDITLLEKSTNKKPNLEYLLLELYSERLKLIHEKNNQDFLSATPVAKDKAKYFRETKKYFMQLKKYGLSLLAKDKKHPYRSEISYNLGMNSRDYDTGDLTERYLLHSIETATKQKTKRSAQIALAEYYYNEKRYAEAIKFYEIIVQDKKDKWLPKHTYNLSWCYLKEKNFEKAPVMMKKALQLNSANGAIKLSDQMLNNLAAFYSFLGKPLEPMNLYISSLQDPVPYLLNLAVKTTEKGLRSETQTILQSTQKLIIQLKVHQHWEAFYHTYLDYFKEYGMYREHVKVSEKLTSYYLKPGAIKVMIEDAKTKIRAAAGFLQLKLTKDLKENSLTYKEEELRYTLSYFDQLILLDPTKKAEYHYYKGETLYSVMKYETAIKSYEASIAEAIASKNLHFASKSIVSLLDIGAKKKLPEEKNREMLVKTYTTQIKYWPKSELSQAIYPKLFEIFLLQNDEKKATGVLIAYNKSYPEDAKKQQALMAKVINGLIDRKDTVKLSAWISEFRKGLFAFPDKDIAQMNKTLGALLLNQFRDLARKGSHDEAIKGLAEIFNGKIYEKDIKGEAALLASMTSLEKLDTVQSYEWQKKAFTTMTEKEMNAHRSELVKIAERFYKLMDFKTSYTLSENILRRYCDKKDVTQKRFFEISIMTAITNEQVDDAQDILRELSHCHTDNEAIEIARIQIYQQLERERKIDNLKEFVSSVNQARITDRYIDTLNQWFWETEDKNLRNKILNEYQSLNKPETIKWKQEYSLYLEASSRKKELEEEGIWIKEKFDGEEFNKKLEAYLGQVNQFKNKYQSLMTSDQPDMIVDSTKLFTALYSSVSKKIEGLSPKGIDKATLKEFKEAMSPISKQFQKIATQYEDKLKEVVLKGDHLFYGARELASFNGLDISVNSAASSIIMDGKGAP